MLKAVNDVEPFNPSVVGLMDKPIDDTPKLKFHKAIDDVRQMPGSEESQKIVGFNVYNEEDNFIGWLYVFIGGVGSLSYAELKPGNPMEVFVFNQSLYAGFKDSVEDLVKISHRCAWHYHRHLLETKGNMGWIPIDIEMTELTPNQFSENGDS